MWRDAALRAVDQAIFGIDSGGLVRYMNRAAEQLCGSSSAESGGHPASGILKLLDPASGEPVGDPCSLMPADGSARSRELHMKLIARDGSSTPVTVCCTLVTSRSGKAGGCMVTLRDESTQLASEEALRNSVKLYRTLVEHSFDAIYMLNGRHYEYVNPRFCEITGYTYTELTSPDFDYNVFLGPESRAFMEERFRARMSSAPIPGQYDLRINTRSGTTVDVEVSTIQLDPGESPRVLGIMRDVTGRRKAEEELRRSESMMKSVLSSMSESVFVFDPDGRFVFVSSPSIELLAPPEQFLSKSYREILPPSVADALAGALARAAEGQSSDFEYSMDLPDMGQAWFEAHLTPVQSGGGFQGSLAVVREVTERRRHEEEQRRFQEQIRQTQKLESLGLLAGGIAHDFNNLLMGILGNAELAAVEIGGSSTAISHIRQIETAARRSAELCRQMMAYSGRGRVTTEKIDVNSIIRSIADLMKVNMPEGAVIRFDLAREIPRIEGDPSQISQVVMNLVLNATEAMLDGAGSITVQTRTMFCDREYLGKSYINDDLDQGEYVYVEVTDTGCGMDRGTLTRIFDPFFSTKFPGRGLGLAAVLGIVRGHKGAVRVYSEPGRGTTFKILLPALSAPASSEGVPEPDSAGCASGRILVIDDEDIVRNVVVRMLQKLGFTVDAAADGTSGLAMFQAGSPAYSCVLLDLAMPGMDGSEVLKAIRALSPTVKILVSSGYNESEVLERLGECPPDGVIQKPFRIERLESAIRESVSGAPGRGDG
jgi:two-component system, cell cycle sensor histidine kinase and response regulator CckA